MAPTDLARCRAEGLALSEEKNVSMPRAGGRGRCPNSCWLTRAWLGGMLLLTALGLPACRTTAVRHVSDPAPAIARLRAGGSVEAEVDRLVKPLVAEGRECGVAVGVVFLDGSTRTFCYGSAGESRASPAPQPNSLFQIGSVSKLFVTALFAQLVAEGRLRPDDTVRSILPADVEVNQEAGKITLDELATHTSGLPREPITLTQLGSFTRYLLTGRCLYAHLNKEYLYRYLRRCRPRAKEQRTFVYSNLGIGLLAHLIEVKTGRLVPDLIVERLCRPLGMRDSGFTLDSNQQSRLTVGHTGNQACFRPANSRMPPWDMGEIMRPVGSMYSTLDDLLLFARANLGLLHHPLEPLLASTQVARVETPRGGEALGWILQRFPPDGVQLTFKDGMIGGYCAYIGLDPHRNVAVVVLRNKFSWDEAIGHNLLLRLAGALSD